MNEITGRPFWSDVTPFLNDVLVTVSSLGRARSRSIRSLLDPLLRRSRAKLWKSGVEVLTSVLRRLKNGARSLAIGLVTLVSWSSWLRAPRRFTKLALAFWRVPGRNLRA